MSNLSFNTDQNSSASTSTFYITETATSPHKNNNLLNVNEIEEKITPLDWYTEFQPLLLKLPKNKFVNNLNWISLFDHNKKVFFFFI